MTSILKRESERLAGQVIVAGFDGKTLPDDVRKSLEDGALGGLILFKRNIESHGQVAEMLGEARKIAPEDRRPVTAVDQEGGRVVRFREPLTVLPPARKFGRVDDPELTMAAGRLVGCELRALGFTLNCAPVLDVDTNPDSPIIGDRSYGTTPKEVIRHGLAFARGLRDGGVFPCAKHFPGHGDATIDSHVSLPRVEHERERLTSIEMEPFAAWARTGLGPIMSAHVVYPALDPDNPATASRPIIRGELREGLRFNGPVLTDDLEMGAIAEHGGPAVVAVQAIHGGVDGLLVCRRPEIRAEVREALVRECEKNPAFARKLEVAAGRLASLAHMTGPRVDVSWIGTSGHDSLKSAVLSMLDKETN
ncbi:MAG: beta-N-acetylhexosaminidase [Deltaproteobacteria bacterium]|nr:beta-N-acetylhexosaminidase [Deltaproteobacteria bacterium]